MDPQSTFFAPAERSSEEELQAQIGLFQSDDLYRGFGNALPVIYLILNANRQVVYANDRVLEALDLNEFSCVYGRRPGELFNCVHASEEAGGCGTSRYCENCGAVQAILGAQSGSRTIKECRLNIEGSLAADFRVMATPMERNGYRFTIFTLEDIQHEKRREALERTFFHDLLNTAGGLSGLVEILEIIDDEQEKEEVLTLLKKGSQRLIEEIHSGRALSQAESGQLVLNRAPHALLGLISEIIQFYESYPVARNRRLCLSEATEPITAETDRPLLMRVVANLLKNALEASQEGGVVTVGLRKVGNEAVITVHNQTAVPPRVRQQIFERSFSTKGAGRGIGTYSVKLFTEKYLEGRVWFESSGEKGTTFSVALPL
ncbi:MAG: HAMP domain-containing sensor histidine kinase [Oceanipulchritudo sp.]